MTKRGQLTPEQKKTAAAGGAASLALAAALAISGVWEGYSNKPYLDPIKIWTVCRGETHVPMREYSDAECDKIDTKRMSDRLEEVRRVNPSITNDPLQWAAHASLANNIGIGNYTRSTTLRLYKQGHEREACNAMASWRLAGGRVWNGLVLRRNGDKARLGEIELCKEGL